MAFEVREGGGEKAAEDVNIDTCVLMDHMVVSGLKALLSGLMMFALHNLVLAWFTISNAAHLQSSPSHGNRSVIRSRECITL